MAEYCDCFKREGKERLIREMQHAPDVAIEMEKDGIISMEEKFGIIAMKDNTSRNTRISEIIEKTYQVQKFISILKRTDNKRCLAVFKGYPEAEASCRTPTEENLRDFIKTQEIRIYELHHEKENLEREVKELQSELRHTRRQSNAYMKKEQQLNDAKKKIGDLKKTISSLENTSGTKSEKIDHLEGKVDLQNEQIQTLTEEHKKSFADMKEQIHSLASQMNESHKSQASQIQKNHEELFEMLSRQNIEGENSSAAQVVKTDRSDRQVRARATNITLPPIKKK